MVVSIAADGAAKARQALERCIGGGGVAVFPADTLYGLACDPLRRGAVERIHALKGRDDGKPSAVMFFAPLAMREILSALGPRTREALGALLPGPVTAVVANPEHRYPLACREDPERLALRLIEGPLAGARCALFQTAPIAAASGRRAASRTSMSGSSRTSTWRSTAASWRRAVDRGGLTALETGARWEVLREGALPRRAREPPSFSADRGRVHPSSTVG